MGSCVGHVAVLCKGDSLKWIRICANNFRSSSQKIIPVIQNIDSYDTVTILVNLYRIILNFIVQFTN